MTEEHPFARFIRILGKGPTLSRTLTEAEMFEAAGMILDGRIEPLQLGAFLCLLRIQTETPEEVAGFVRAARATLSVPPDAPPVALDWPSYAGKARRLPWFLLAALLLARNGVSVFMHGLDGHTPGRLHAGSALASLGVPTARSLADAAGHLRVRNLAYLPLEHLSPRLAEIMALKSVLGLRSPVHTMARKLNPFNAPCQIIGVAHPPYQRLHQQAGTLLGQPRLAVVKGEGGEAERRPEKSCLVHLVEDGALREEEWAPLLDGPAPVPDGMLEPSRLRAVWTGEAEDAVGVAAVIGTAAVALKLLGRAVTQGEAQSLAEAWWRGRSRAL